MNTKNFRVPMLNTLRIGPYDFPYETNSSSQEWLITSRQERQSSYLTISDTATAVGADGDTAPDGLTEQNTIVAALAEEGDGKSQFLMLRHLPEGIQIFGRFFPADGAAALVIVDGKLQLNAFGRHAHCRGSSGVNSILHDIPNPPPNAEGAINWHFAAEERPLSNLN